MRVKDFLNASRLLFSKLTQAITDKEQEELNRWEKLSDENTAIVKNVLDKSRVKQNIEKHKLYDSEQAFRKFSKRVSKTKKVNMFTNVLKYAAGVAVIISISVFLYNDFHKMDKYDYAKNIEPGGKKALLILANNKKVNLDIDKNKKIETANSLINNTSGQLSYQKKISDKKNLRYNTLIIAKGEEYQLILSDGTKVFINSDSKLRYPENFVGKERRVFLEGEAFFEVAQDKTKPFIVETKDYNINVLGTHFNVSHYRTDDVVHTTLVEGKVEISSIKGLIKRKFELKPNQQFSFNKSELKSEVKDVDAYIYKAWTEGYFVFENEKLENIFKKLERWYDLNVFFADPTVSNKTFSGKLPKFEDFNIILNMLETIDHIDIEIDGKNVILKNY
ncbi:MAG: FecR domain-containing protein [Bacteroidales bacterium]|nr:FecR domain-containing protein [Bacteroidales bacterium]